MKASFAITCLTLSLCTAPFFSEGHTSSSVEMLKQYRVLNTDSLKDYLYAQNALADRLGGTPADWKAREVGDGNLNLVFIVEGPQGALVVKQALPYVRLIGESWPLPTTRAYYEHEALIEEAKVAPQYVPAVYHFDNAMYLTVMEYLHPHIILRKGLIQGIKYPHMAKHIGEFMALTLFCTSDLHLPAAVKKEKIALFASNTAMCKITEDLIFDEPYFDAPLNHWTTPQLDEIALAFRKDSALKLAVQSLKWKFLSQAEALIHADLHTGSIMVTENDTRAIDAEFAFYGPMGFDIGAVIGNLLLAYFAQPGQAEKPGARDAYAEWILEQIPIVWHTFASRFGELWRERNASLPGGDVFAVRLGVDAPDLQEKAIQKRMRAIWRDTLGFAGAKMIRRIFGLAHVQDMECITDPDVRSACETKALNFARSLILETSSMKTPEALIEKARNAELLSK